MHLRPFDPTDTDAVIALWTACQLVRPWNDPRADIVRKMTEQPELFIVGEIDDRLVATAMAGFDGHRGWVHYLAVDPDSRRSGLGRQLMAEVERLLREAGCPKLNLQVRSDNLAVLGFYRGLGYGEDQVVSLGKRLILDES
ncbi:GNAT family acetyltransferase [Glaciihabitans sp. UYNi722]|uniref:GNAT family acetyltransferase n=1 Tax=Glaciihabitans sp. UYNi722 TaxID=3156344 RepID=UPI0033929554